MLNSLTIFLAFLAFIVFGYLSLLKLSSRLEFGNTSSFIINLTSAFKDSRLFQNLGASAFFVSLPAVALLLFWGWGPALIWLVVFHFLIESLPQLHFSSLDNKFSVADLLLRAEDGPKALLEQGIIQVFFLLFMSVVVTLVATLIDRQPGLLFALLFLLPARQLVSHTSAALKLPVRYIGGLILIITGLAFSDQLGFSVYGDWAPFGDAVPWLLFNMPTLIAAIVVVAVFKLETNQGFKKDLSLFAGGIILLLVIAMIVKLAWLRPILDAPLNAGTDIDNSNLPSLITLSFFIFAGFGAFIVQILNEEEKSYDDASARYGRLQIGSLTITVYMALLIVSLAAALGIGAWKTHFIEWSSNINILDYLNLAITSNLNLIYQYADSGTLLHTGLLAALCFTGFSFLLMCANQLTLEEAENESLFSIIVQAKIPQAIGIFVASCYFIGNGISIQFWMMIGLLAWFLFCHLLVGMNLQKTNQVNIICCLAIIGIGLGQAALMVVTWFASAQYLFGALFLLVSATAIALWIRDIKTIVQSLGKQEKDSFL